MKTILVPVDGSPHAGRALDIACDLAEKHGAGIKLLHVLLRERDPAELLSLPAAGRLPTHVAAALKSQQAAPAPDLSVDEIMRAPGAAAKHVNPDHLQAVAAAILGAAEDQVVARGLACTSLPIGHGHPATDIVAAAREAHADAIVMGSRGLGEVAAFTLGSASQAVCHDAPCTCIMVH